MKQTNNIPQLDKSKLTPEQRDRLDSYNQATAQIKSLKDIADMAEGILSALDNQKQEGTKSSKEMGALLVDMRDSLMALKDKEMPEMPAMDHKPVIDAVNKLETAISKAIKGIDVKPIVNVDAPQVHLNPTEVDLKGIEKVLKVDIPKAFKEAMMMMPMPEKDDYSPLLDAWKGISDQLLSIENVTRMKPLPGTIRISNLSSITPQTNSLTDTELRATPVPVSGTVTENNSAAIKTAVETLDNAIAGTEMQVDIVGALPSGTNAIGGIVLQGTNAQLKDDASYGENVTSGIASVANRLWDGVAYDRAPGNSTDGMLVNLGTNNDITISGPAGTALNTYSVRLTTNTTTTPIASTAYISSITISSEIGGTTSTLTIQDKQGTPLKLVNGFTTVAVTTTPSMMNFQTPIKMTSGIDIITAGVAAATLDIWINYYA